MIKLSNRDNLSASRQMHTVLVMHFIEERSQKDIADSLNISHATVNRLIKRGRSIGLVQITIKSPVVDLVEIEDAILDLGYLSKVIVVPTLSDKVDTVLKDVGRAAAQYLVDILQPHNKVTITGGKGLSAVASALAENDTKSPEVKVIPATGLVQGHHYIDVNHIAAQMAERLGGQAYEIHAPLFADTREIRDMLLSMTSVKSVFDHARSADIAVLGVGSILTDDSSYYDLNPHSSTDRDAIKNSGATAELLAHLIDKDGQICDYELNHRLVGLKLEELLNIPHKIGVAAGVNKAEPILNALRGGYIDTLVTDEVTGQKLIEFAKQ